MVFVLYPREKKQLIFQLLNKKSCANTLFKRASNYSCFYFNRRRRNHSQRWGHVFPFTKTTHTRPPTYLWTTLPSPVACLFTTIDVLWTQTVGGFTVGSHFNAHLCDLYIHLCNTPLFCTYTCKLFPPFDTKSQSSLSTTHLDPLCAPPFPLLFICAFFFLFSTCFYSAFFSLQIRKLRRELDASQEKVSALTTQLSANVGGHRYILLRWLFILLLYLRGIINFQYRILCQLSTWGVI